MKLTETLNCPSCRREHQIDLVRLTPAVCSRCACELDLLVAIRISAADQLAKAWQAIRDLEYPTATEYVESAWSLIASKKIAQCGLTVSVLKQDKPGIRKWQRRAKKDL